MAAIPVVYAKRPSLFYPVYAAIRTEAACAPSMHVILGPLLLTRFSAECVD